MTNLIRLLINAGCSANSCSNDSAGPIGMSLFIVFVSSSAPSSLYIFPPAVVWIRTGVLYFVGWYSLVVSIHINYVPLFVRSYIFHSVSS